MTLGERFRSIAAGARTGSSRAWIVLGVLWIYGTAKLLLSYHFHTFFGEVWGVADDVYITADFSRTIAEGGGIRWFPGAPKVEGSSSPLWMFAIAPLHYLPGFSESRLGLFVFGLNTAILLGSAWALLRAIELTLRHAGIEQGRARPFGGWSALWLPLLGFVTVSFCSWTSRGFEVALVALLSLCSYVEALRPEGIRPWRLGLLLGLASWARLDAGLYCLPTLLALFLRPSERRRAFSAVAIAAGILVLQSVARFAYFGEWLPNTYYLKATKWPVLLRLPNGIRQNVISLWVCALGLPPIWFVLWRFARHGRLLAFGLTLTHVLVVLYSTSLGGDFSFESLGFDRFTSISLLFLVAGLMCVLVITELPQLAKRALGFACLMIAWFPLWFRPLFPGAVARVRPFHWSPIYHLSEPLLPPDDFANLFIHVGKSVEEVTWPGAKVAVCAAGAIPYFSHRPGVDLLGKIDPVIARLPATAKAPPFSRCWQDNVGHNKEDMGLSYRLHRPDLFTVEPPPEAQAQYVRFLHRTMTYWAFKDSPHIAWQKIDLFASGGAHRHWRIARHTPSEFAAKPETLAVLPGTD